MRESEALKAWVAAYSPNALSGLSVQLEPVSGDAGFRKYYRINSSPSLLVAVAPPECENNRGFVNIGLAFTQAGVHVPRVYAVDYRRGYVLQEDLGADLLLCLLNKRSVDELYSRALATLLRIQAVPADPAIFPPYSPQKLRDEMSLFGDWFVKALLKHSLLPADDEMLEQLFAELQSSAAAQPQVVVHRDYHSRNLIALPGQGMGVIDFQDAVIGPLTYDVVSLLRDCYVRWPEAVVNRHTANFMASQQRAGLLDASVSFPLYKQWLDLIGLQRHIKVLGIFARLWLRDGKPAYLDDLPLVIRYTLEVAGKYPQTRAFRDWFLNALEPRLKAQPWYRSWQTAGDGA